MFFTRSMTISDEELIGAVPAARSKPAAGPADTALVERLRSGEAEAYEELVDRFSGEIYGLAFRLTSDAADAADITQEVFIQAFRSIEGFRGEANLRTWLFRIVVNRARNRFRWWKRKRRDTTYSIDAPIGDGDATIADSLIDRSRSPEQDAIDSERMRALTKALAELKPIYREAVILADVEGLSYRECSAALGIDIGTVRSRISRGRDELRQRLKDI